MPLWIWRPLFRFWLSVVRADPDHARAVKELLVTYDDAYRALDLAAIDYDGGVHPKHRLTHYHDFFVERVQPGDVVLDIGSGKGELAYDLVTRGGASVSVSTTIRATWRTPAPTSSTSGSSFAPATFSKTFRSGTSTWS